MIITDSVEDKIEDQINGLLVIEEELKYKDQ